MTLVIKRIFLLVGDIRDMGPVPEREDPWRRARQPASILAWESQRTEESVGLQVHGGCKDLDRHKQLEGMQAGNYFRL